MTKIRHDKVAGISRYIAPAEVDQGEDHGDLLVVGWGSTYGSIKEAVRILRDDGREVSHLHLRHIWPLPEGLDDLFRSFNTVLVPELNNGQLVKLLRAEYLVAAESLTRVTGKPFQIQALVRAVEERLQRSAT